MNKIRFGSLSKQLRSISNLKSHTRYPRFFSTDKESEIVKDEEQQCQENKEKVQSVQLSGFAKSYEKFNESIQQPIEKSASFAYLLRHSKFINLGDPLNKIVTGKIYKVVDDDLYIDFGWKFPCVCQRPQKNGKLYVRNAIVRLKIKNLELSSLFLGATKDLTLLEADCILLGILKSPLLASSK